MSYWKVYGSHLFQNILGEQKPEKNLKYYKNQLFYYIILYSTAFSPVAIIPGIIASYKTNFIDLLILNVATFIILVFLGFARRIKIETRKVILIALLYIISWSLLFNLNLEGPGLLYLLSVTIVCSLIYSTKIAFQIVILNSVILGILGLNILFEWIPLSLTAQQSMTTWFGIVSNLIFLSIIIIAFFEIMFKKLDQIITEQGVLNETIKQDNLEIQEKSKELAEKNEELNQFAHTIAHDLKEPLRSMQAFSQLIINKYQNDIPKQGQDFLNHIKTSSVRMALLLDSLLEYAQIGKDKKVSVFDTYDLIGELEKDLSQLIKENNAKIQYEQLPAIRGFEFEFKQLMQNLLTNAIKFKKDEQDIKIKIIAAEKPQLWKFVVSDNGIGIEPNQKEKIFIIFRRLHQQKYPGTGLGLANCKKIVEMHGGEIWVESKPDQGSDFCFTISKEL